MSNQVLEIARFAVVDGIDTETVRARAHSLDAWLTSQPGFVARTLVGPDPQGQWLDLVRWRSQADATAAADAIAAVPEAGPFMALIDPSSVTMSHLPVVATL